MNVQKVKLSEDNHFIYSKLFKRCFTEKWKSSVIDIDDDVYAAFDNTKLVGFCMTHPTTAKKMKFGPGVYMYNLCVDPEYRRNGVGSSIVNAVTSEYPLCYSHIPMNDDDKSMFMNKAGWTRIGTQYHYYEYAKGYDLIEAPKKEYNLKHYDAVQNIIYLTPMQ